MLSAVWLKYLLYHKLPTLLPRGLEPHFHHLEHKNLQIMDEARRSLMNDSIGPTLQANARVGKQEYIVESSSVFIKLTSSSDQKELFFKYVDIIGASISVDDPLNLIIHSYPVPTPKSCSKSKEREYKEVVLTFEDRETVSGWHREIYQRLDEFCACKRGVLKRRILVFVNPFAGKKKAPKVWKQVSDLFKRTNSYIDVYETQAQNDARNKVLNMPVGEYDTIVSVSGDGLIHEIINGVMARPDSAEFWNETQLGIMPGGSANALSKCICDASGEELTPTNCAYLIAKGDHTKLDLTKLETEKNGVVFSFMSVAWGYIAEVDIWSEVLRWMGSLRFDLYGFYRVMALNRYRGNFAFSSTAYPDMTMVDKIPENEDWQIIDDTFSSIMTMNVPFIASWSRLSPRSTFGDGENECILNYGKMSGRRKMSKFLLFQMDGSWIKNGEVASGAATWGAKAKAWRFTPVDNTQSLYSIDGEPYDSQIIHGNIIPSVVPLCSMPL